MDTPSSSPSIPKRFHALVSSASQLPNISFLSTRSSGSTSQSKSVSSENDSLLLIDPRLGNNLYIKLFNFHKKMPNEDFYFQEYLQQDDQNSFDVLYCGKDNLTPKIFVINKKIILGQGAQGIVYLAQEIFKDKNTNDSLAAIKFLPIGSAQRKQDFHHEKKLLSLQNRCRGSYYDKKQLIGCIVQDYCYGKNFFDWCYKKRGMTEQNQRNIYGRTKVNSLLKKRFVTAILQAYHDLHQTYGIFHRDIKPENIMIEITDSDEIIVKIIDFATSCLMQHSDKNFSGTLGYLPPETTYDMTNRPYTSLQTEYWSIGVICAAWLSEKNYLNYLNTKMATAQRKTGFIPDCKQKDLFKALPDIFSTKEPNVRLLRRNQNSTSSSSSYSCPSPTLSWTDYLNQCLCWLAHPNVNLRPCHQDITRILENLRLYEKNEYLLDTYAESILSERISNIIISPAKEEKKIEIDIKIETGKEKRELKPMIELIEIEDAGSSSSREVELHERKSKKHYHAKK